MKGRSPAHSPADALPFAVVDIETTGFSPRLHDRIIEIAIVRVAPDGSGQDEYATLVNPLRDIGPTRVHGITATDVIQAPTFVEVMGDVLQRLSKAVLVAHNVRFDRDFLAAEFSMAGIFLPSIPCLCTLQLAYRLHPGLDNHRLSTCCAAAGFHHDRIHSALDDARAVAHLLVAYLRQAHAAGWTTLSDLGCSPVEFPNNLWPSLPASGKCVMRPPAGRPAPAEVPFLARLVASLSGVSVGAKVAPYMDLLDRVLEDRLVSGSEAEALQATAIEWGLSREEIIGAHHAYLDSLINAALADGTISESERRDLEAVTRLLALDPAVLHAMVDRTAGAAPVWPPVAPPTAHPSDDLAGLTVCFTGALSGVLGDLPITRQMARELAEAAGLRVITAVTKDLDILVVADPNTQSGKARKARQYGTRIMAEAAFWRAIGVQVH